MDQISLNCKTLKLLRFKFHWHYPPKKKQTYPFILVLKSSIESFDLFKTLKIIKLKFFWTSHKMRPNYYCRYCYTRMTRAATASTFTALKLPEGQSDTIDTPEC